MKDKRAHAKLGVTHAESIGFFNGFTIIPAIVFDPVAGDNRSGAILAAAAMDEEAAGRVVEHQ